MKIIDLLIGIANGEEVPNRVIFNNVIWNKVYGEKNIFYENEYDDDLFIYFFRKNLDFTLNDEVEIIEEKKIPEKLKSLNNVGNVPNLVEFVDKQQLNNHLLKDKLNEIIDFLKKN